MEPPEQSHRRLWRKGRWLMKWQVRMQKKRMMMDAILKTPKRIG